MKPREKLYQNDGKKSGEGQEVFMIQGILLVEALACMAATEMR